MLGATYGLPDRYRLRCHCDIGIVSCTSLLAQSPTLSSSTPASPFRRLIVSRSFSSPVRGFTEWIVRRELRVLTFVHEMSVALKPIALTLLLLFSLRWFLARMRKTAGGVRIERDNTAGYDTISRCDNNLDLLSLHK